MNRRPVLFTVVTLIAGAIFGAGLAISSMIDPQKVKDFLDFAAIPSGGWDPSLAFVMGGAVVVAFFFYRFAAPRPVAAPDFHLSLQTGLDRRLLGGAAIFGVGWGLSGLCPGPAIADIAIVPGDVLVFVIALAAGSWATGFYGAFRSRQASLGNVPAE